MSLRSSTILGIFFILFHMGLFAQSGKKVVITEIKYVLVNNTANEINSITFPFYFNDDEFFEAISSSLIKSLKEKFNVDDVSLMSGTTIEYGNGKPIKNIKPRIPENSLEDEIYVGINSFIKYDNFDSENDCYDLVTLVGAADKSGKMIYESTNKIPFKIRYGDWILSDTVMNWRDFEYFYIQGIEAAIKGDPKKFEPQIIDHQSAGEYDPFVANSIKYKVITGKDNYSLEKDDQTKISIININSLPESGLSAYGSIEGVYRFQVENLIEKKNYTLELYGSKDYINDWDYNINVVSKLDSKNEKTRAFVLDADYILTGNIDEKQIGVYWNADKSVAEFVVDDQLVALLHEQNKQRTFYYIIDSAGFNSGEIYNIMVIYHLSTIILKETEDIILLQNSSE